MAISTLSSNQAVSGTMRPPPTPGPQTFDTASVLRCAVEGRLLRISVEVTRACNLGCTYCYVPVTPSSGRPLSHDEILDVAKQAQALGAQTFVIIGGEPLLYPGLPDLVRQLRTMGFSISMFSNLTRLTPEMAELLYEHDVFVTGKLNSLDEGVNDSLACHRGAHRAYMKAIDLLRYWGFAEPEHRRLALHSIISHENVTGIPPLFRWMRNRDIIPHFQLLTRTGRASAGMTPLSPQEAKHLFYTLLNIDQTEFGYTWIPTPPLVGWSCQQYYCSAYVTNDGRVKPCSSSATILGSVRNSSLAQILSLPIFRRLREIRCHIDGPCRSCKENVMCYGCRADAEAAGGSLFARDAYCWRH